jgi:hypothetical protein
MATVTKKVGDLRALLDLLQGDVFAVGPRKESFSALERLMALVIQGSGKMASAEKGIQALQGQFGNWSEVRVARAFEIRDVLKSHSVAYAAERSVLIQEYLRRVFGLQNHLELDWLYDATSERRDRLLSQLTMAPDHTAAVLDLDALEEGDQTPVCKQIKLLFARLGLVKPNPKEADVRAMLEPLVEGKDYYPNFIKLRLVALHGADPKNPQGRSAHLLQVLWKERGGKNLKAFAEAAMEMKLPVEGQLAAALKPAPAKKKATAKKAANADVAPKNVTKKAVKKKATNKKAAN